MLKLDAVWRNLRQGVRHNKGERQLAVMKAIIFVSGLALGIYFRDAFGTLFPELDRPLDEVLISFFGVSSVLLSILSVPLLVNLLQRTKRR